MKASKIDTSQARRILTALIVHDDVLATVCHSLGSDHRPFNQKWLDTIAGWCFQYFAKYGQAPKQALHAVFEKYASRHKDTDTLELIESFLSNLSRDYEGLKKEMNEQFMVDLASTYFQRVRLQRLIEEMESSVVAGDIEAAENLRLAYQPIDFSSTAAIDPLSKDAALRTFRLSDLSEVVVQWSGGMDRFLSSQFRRGEFIAFCGPEKRGKSYWLMETAYRAMRQGRKVLYYVFGDMPEHEVLQRFYSRVLRRPWRSKTIHLPHGALRFIRGEGGIPKVEFAVEEKKMRGCRPLDVKAARKRLLRITASRQVNLKLIVRGGYELTASAIEQEVKNLTLRDGWVPDLVVIDYADLIEAELDTKRQDVRHQINKTWSILRRIALANHCLVVTASQGSARSYKRKWTMKKDDFSEDKRKNAHVSGMIGINQTPDEKRQGVYRLNWIAVRSAHWTENQVVWTAGCLDIACPCVVSKIDLKTDNEA